jgi:hypothetical protein
MQLKLSCGDETGTGAWTIWTCTSEVVLAKVFWIDQLFTLRKRSSSYEILRQCKTVKTFAYF